MAYYDPTNNFSNYAPSSAAVLKYLITLHTDTQLHVNIFPLVDGNATNWAGKFINRGGELRYVDPATHQVLPWATSFTLPCQASDPRMEEAYAWTDPPTLIAAYTNMLKIEWAGPNQFLPEQSLWDPDNAINGGGNNVYTLNQYLAAPTAPQFYWHFNPLQQSLNMDFVRSIGAA